MSSRRKETSSHRAKEYDWLDKQAARISAVARDSSPTSQAGSSGSTRHKSDDDNKERQKTPEKVQPYVYSPLTDEEWEVINADMECLKKMKSKRELQEEEEMVRDFERSCSRSRSRESSASSSQFTKLRRPNPTDQSWRSRGSETRTSGLYERELEKEAGYRHRSPHHRRTSKSRSPYRQRSRTRSRTPPKEKERSGNRGRVGNLRDQRDGGRRSRSRTPKEREKGGNRRDQRDGGHKDEKEPKKL